MGRPEHAVGSKVKPHERAPGIVSTAPAAIIADGSRFERTNETMFVTVECEAAVIGCRGVRPELDANLPCVLALPGADHVLEALPDDRWVLLSHRDDAATREALTAAELPAPALVVVSPDDHLPAHYLEAATSLHADPQVCLAFEDTEAGVTAAKAAGMQVIGVAANVDPIELGAADFVVPSLLSVRVLGAHPFLVFEVDAIPDIGTQVARRR